MRTCPQDKLAYTCGGIVVAGLLYLALALVIRLVGVKQVMRFLPPVVTGPIIVCIGLSLAPSAVRNAATCWPLALIALATIVVFNIWGKGLFKIIPILMGVVVSYIAALIMNACGVTVLNAAGEAIPLIDFTAVREASILGLPPFQMAKFDLTSYPGDGPHRRGGHDGAHRRYVRHLRHRGAELHSGARPAPHPGGRRHCHRPGRHVRRPRQHHLRREHRRAGPVQGP